MTPNPAVVVAPNISWGRPQIKGAPTEVLADLWWVGEGAAEIQDDYGLTRHELLVALWFEGSQGQPRFRRRWREWVEEVAPVLWRSSVLDPDAVPLPPDRDDASTTPAAGT